MKRLLRKLKDLIFGPNGYDAEEVEQVLPDDSLEIREGNRHAQMESGTKLPG